MIVKLLEALRPERRILQILPGAGVAAVMLWLAVTRMRLVESVAVRAIGETGTSFAGLALKHDLAVFLVLAGLYYVASLSPIRILGVVSRACAVPVVLFYAADVLVLKYFSLRMSYSDVAKFTTEWEVGRTVFAQLFPGASWLTYLILLLFMALLFWFVVIDVRPMSPRGNLLALGVLCLWIGGSFLGDSGAYVHGWIFENFFEVNAGQGIAERYSEAYADRLERSADPVFSRETCIPGLASKKNVVFVLWESLSMYHSNHASGLPTMAPQFDRIARDNTTYVNFFSNGFTTEAALIALLTGKVMYPPLIDYDPASWDFGFSFIGFRDVEASLPALFYENGYTTLFMTTGDLRFLSKGYWLGKIGFDFIEGAEQSYYRSWPRGHFNAAPDEALYKRFLGLAEVLRQRQPYFAVLETVSTHQPFFDPYTRSSREEAVFAGADASLGRFYDELVRTDFFEDGVLVIAGDHRSMTGLRHEETALFGASAAARVPLVIAYGDGHPAKRIEAFAQQTDFIPAFEYLVAEESCTGPLHGNFLADPPIEPPMIQFPRGDDRDLVDVYKPDGTVATVRIDGDETRVVRGSLQQEEVLVQHIGLERLSTARALREQSGG